MERAYKGFFFGVKGSCTLMGVGAGYRDWFQRNPLINII